MTLDERRLNADKLLNMLPTLRKEYGVSQQGLADIAGLSRSTITKLVGKRELLTWHASLALFLIFKGNARTAILLKAFEIDTDVVNEFLSGKIKEDLK